MNDSQGLRLVFAGTPAFAAKHLQSLINSNHTVAGVYTQPDRPAGRGKVLSPSPVKQIALENGLPVYQPQSLKPLEEQQKLRLLNADVMVVVAYGLLLPLHILETPTFGCLNVHASLLPRWRGAAPIQRAIEAGDSETGITIMQMDEGLDTGDMLLKMNCPIYDDDTASALHDRLAELGSPALLQTLSHIANGTAQRHVQDSALSNYAKKLSKHEALIDWQLDAQTLCQKIRAFNPVPVCYSHVGDKRVRIFLAKPLALDSSAYTPGEVIALNAEGLHIACGKGAINVLELQLPSKKLMSIKAFYNGQANLIRVGTRFT